MPWSAAIAVGVLGILVVGAAGFRVVRVAGRLERARDSLTRAEVAVKAGELATARRQLTDAQVGLLSANNQVRAPEFALLGWLPVARQNIVALRSSVEVGLSLVNGGQRILEAAQPLAGPDGRLNVRLNGGQVPVEAIVATQVEVEELGTILPGRGERRASPFLLPALSRLQNRVYSEAARRKAEFQGLGAGLRLLADMAGADGDRRYLLAVANTAEMRGTGGMILSYGVLSSHVGRFALDRVGPIDDLRLAGPVGLAEPPDYVDRFSELRPTELWRSVNAGGDFTRAAPVMEAMYTAATGLPVDGVIQIDPAGLAAVLEGIGPIEVPPLGSVSSANVVALTLNEAYVKFPARPVRQEYLQEVAEAAFRKLLAGDYPSVQTLAAAVARSAAGRHILVHSTRPQTQSAVGQLAIDGSFPDDGGDFAQLTVQNLAANKLDYYLDTALSVTVNREAGKVAQVHASIQIDNTAPPNGEPSYIFGPAPGFAVVPPLQRSEYRGLVSLYLPPASRLVGYSGAPLVGTPAVESEDGRTVVAFGVSLPAGERRVVTLDLVLPTRPSAGYRWDFVPTPRVRPTQVAINLRLDGHTYETSGALERAVTVRSPG